MTTLASTLVHFIWQGTLVALGVAIFLRFGPRAASARYAAGVVGLGVMLVTPVATYVALSADGLASGAGQVSWPLGSTVEMAPALGLAADDTAGAVAPAGPRRSAMVPIVVSVWACGVLLLSIRLTGGWVVARRLASKVVAPVAPGLLVVAADVSSRLGVRRTVRILESPACVVPVVIGWLRPVVLLPVSAMAGMSAVQIEALLAHELAHVRRHDYLVNLLQAAVETLLFYHPGVWWVSRRVRIEREHCCDDLAVSVCDRIDYASALSALATVTSTRGLALAATDGPLLARVKRLLGQPATPRPAASLGFAIVTVVAVAALIPTATAAVARRPVVGAPPVAVAVRVTAPSIADEAGTPGLPVVEALPHATVSQVSPQSQHPEPPMVTRTAEGADSFLAQQVEELARQLRSLADEREMLEREAAKEQHRAQRTELVVRLDSLRAAHQEAKAHFEIGLANAGHVRDIETQIAAVQRSVEALDRDAQLRDAHADLLRRQEQVMTQFDVMRTRQASAVQEREIQVANQSQQGREVAVSCGAVRGGFAPAPQPYTHGGGESVICRLSESARTPDGKPISGMRFIGWREGEATRVIALAVVPRGGEPSAITTDANRFEEREVGTYLIRFGELLELQDLGALGISNVWISSVLPVR